MEKRDKSFWIVGFYLSKFGEKSNIKNSTLPPSRLNTHKWNEAYRMFYDSLGGNRTIVAFERSLKNARDTFDSHLPQSGRSGWRTKDRKPNPLKNESKKVFDYCNELTEQEVWDEVKEHVSLGIKDYPELVNDIIALQEEQRKYEKEKEGKTEGGAKVVTSIKYERNLTNRGEAVKVHGLNCQVCGFNYEATYGEWGKGFIEVHHIQALSDNKGKERTVNPTSDLTVLCANCHRMVHRKKGIVLTIEELKEKMKK